MMKCILYYDNGEIMFEANIETQYVNGIVYYENKNKKFEGIFKLPQLIFKLPLSIDANKDILLSYRHGKGIEYYESGEKRFEGTYKNGNLHGKCIGFFRDGKKMYEGNCINGKADGKGTLYYQDGKVEFQGNFKDGRKSGNGIQYYESGEKHYEGAFKNGTADGKGTFYYKDGKKKYEGNCINGRYDGKGTSYYQDGQVAFQGEWVDGRRLITTKDKKSIIKANQILEKNEDFFLKARGKNLLSPINMQLAVHPVMLRTVDDQNKQFDEQENVYDKRQIENLPTNSLSPITRRRIISTKINVQKRKQILQFVKQVIEKDSEKQTEKQKEKQTEKSNPKK